MIKNRRKKLSNFKLQRNARAGITAVEFALVCPLVLTVVFGMLEISRASTISNTARTSLIAGAREATVAQTNSDNVTAEIDRIMGFFGVGDRQVTVTPTAIDGSVDEVRIQLSVPFNGNNRQYLGRLMGSRILDLDITVQRN